VQGVLNSFSSVQGYRSMYSRHPFFRHFSPVSYISHPFSPTLYARTRSHVYTRTRHALSQFSSFRLFHRLFGLIRHFHQPTSLSPGSHSELALNTRFLIDFSPSRALTGSLADPIFSLAPTAFRRRKTGRLLSIMKYWTAVSTPMVITTNYDIRPTRKYRDRQVSNLNSSSC